MYKQKKIEKWAEEKGIYYGGGNFIAQMKGIAEEVVEATEAYTQADYSIGAAPSIALESELGDIYVFWINACWIAGIDPKDAVNAAYEKISKRTGSMKDGRFVKEGMW